MKKIIHVIMFAAAFFFLWNTEIVNRTEAEDAFAYAYQVENSGHDWLYHPHHLLYGTSAKGIYVGAKALGYTGRAYPMLRLISALCGAGAVLMFFRFCYRRFSMRPVSSLLCSGLLLFSYGFWRYGNEAEVIAPACFVMLCALYLSVVPNRFASAAVVAGVLCGISVLFHILNVIPVFLAVPLFYILQKNWKGMFLNAFAAAAVAATGYFWVYFFEPAKIISGHTTFLSWSWSAIVKGAIGFSQCIVSSNFLLGFEGVREALVKLFPSRMLLEELYMGRVLSSGLVFSAALTMLFLILCFAGTTVFALSLLLKRGGVKRRERMGAAEGWQTLAVTLVWFGGYAGALLLLEPGNPEVWVMGLVPFWLAFCGLIVAPLSRQNVLWPVLLLVVLMGLHNYIGGMRPLKNPDGDYNLQKAAWILKNTGAGDVVLTADNPVFERYLRYYCPARVEYLHGWGGDRLALAEGVPSLGFLGKGRILLLGDLFSIPVSMTHRFPASSSSIERFAEKIRSSTEQVYDDEFGGVYVLKEER